MMLIGLQGYISLRRVLMFTRAKLKRDPAQCNSRRSRLYKRGNL